MKFLYLVLLLGYISFGQNLNSMPMPKKIIQKDGIEIKSYDYQSINEVFNLKDDKIYVINFWATWCLPCVKELPFFEQLGANYKNVEVVLISLDMPSKIESVLIPFILKKKLQSEVIHLDDPDANSWIEKVDKNWSGAIPATVIYNLKNKKFYEQSFTYETLEKEIKHFIN